MVVQTFPLRLHHDPDTRKLKPSSMATLHTEVPNCTIPWTGKDLCALHEMENHLYTAATVRFENFSLHGFGKQSPMDQLMSPSVVAPFAISHVYTCCGTKPNEHSALICAAPVGGIAEVEAFFNGYYVTALGSQAASREFCQTLLYIKNSGRNVRGSHVEQNPEQQIVLRGMEDWKIILRNVERVQNAVLCFGRKRAVCEAIMLEVRYHLSHFHDIINRLNVTHHPDIVKAYAGTLPQYVHALALYELMESDALN